MDILITGHRGVLGRALANELLQRGHSIRGFDLLDGMDVENWDLLCESLRYADATVHLAGPSSSILFDREPALSWRNTVLPLYRLLGSGFGGYILYPSSATVYGARTLPSQEGDYLQVSTSLYANAKRECERLCMQAATAGANVVICRIFTGYGADESRKAGYSSPPYEFMRSAVSGAEVTIFGNGEQIRDFVYADDVARAMACILEIRPKSQIFNIGTGVSHSFNEVVSLIRELLSSEPVVRRVSMPGNYIRYSVANIERARKELGWSPLVSLADGLSAILRELKQPETKS